MATFPPKLEIIEQHNAAGEVTGYKLPDRKEQIEAYNELRQFVIDHLINQLPPADEPSTELEEDFTADTSLWPDFTGYQLSNQVSETSPGKYRVVIWDERFTSFAQAKDFADDMCVVLNTPPSKRM